MDPQAHYQAMLLKYPSLAKADAEDNEDAKESHDGREQVLLDFVKHRPDIDSIRDNPSHLLEVMDEFSAQQDFLISIGHDKTRIIAATLAEEKPRTLVELGGYVGYSAIFFANEMRKHWPSSTKLQVWSLEFAASIADIAREFIAMAGLEDSITVITGPADASLRSLKSEGKIDHVDFLFLDHDEEMYEQDFRVAMEELNLLNKGALVVADNVTRPGAPKYREYARSNQGLKSWGVKALIMPGEFEDELEYTRVL